MTNKTTSTENLKSTNTQSDTVLELTGDLTPEQVTQVKEDLVKSNDVVAEVLKGGKLKGLKATAKKRDWISIIGTGVIGMSGAAADMIVTNKLISNVHGEDAPQYSVKEIIGVTVVTGLVASTVRAGLDFVPQVHNSDAVGLATTSLVGNGSFVAASLLRNSVLGLVKSKFSVSVEELAEEA